MGLVALGLAGCAGSPLLPRETANGVTIEIPSQPLECVPYARGQSGLAIHGDAWTWWEQAAGRYVRGTAPIPGGVLVFSRDGGPPGGHVAVVRQIVSRREIRVDHANWLGRGRIYLNDPVVDVSAAGDWSQVRVWNAETQGWGIRTYPISGFVGPGAATRIAAEPAS